MDPLVPTETFCSAPGVTILSPHCDDAAFSLAGLVRVCLDQGKPVTVINCFSHSAYAPKLFFRSPERVSRIRKEEDGAFAALMDNHCRMLWLDLPEAPLRPDHHHGDTCTSQPLTAGDLALAVKISEYLQENVKADNLVLIPLGLGFHVDHRIVREAGLSLAGEGFPSLFLYEELPYAAAFSLANLDSWMGGVSKCQGIQLVPFHVTFSDLLTCKAAAARCYPSQAPAYVLDRILGHARRVDPSGKGAERLWLFSYAKTRKEAHELACREDWSPTPAAV